MKTFKLIFYLLLILSTSSLNGQDDIKNLMTFAKAYGYAKYFHPSSESSNIDWNAFAVHGAFEISKCKNHEEVIKTLNQLFKPIGPAIHFSKTKKGFDLKTITPDNLEGYTSTYWQHKGVSKDMSRPNGIYSSVKVNQLSEIDESDSFGNLTYTLKPEKYKGKEIKYTGWVKLKRGSKGTGHLWLRVDKEDGSTGFFNNMGGTPIKSTKWMQYEIIGNVDSLASNILIGSYISGKGNLYLDDVALHYKENDEWIEIPISNNGFEKEKIGIERNENIQWVGKSKGYSYNIATTEKKSGKACASISYEGVITKVMGESIFEAFPKFGELIEKEIGKDIYCQIPLNLYFNEEGTYPKSTKIKKTLEILDHLIPDVTESAFRYGNVINVYNVFQHFYPYFDVINIDWDKELEIALNRSYNDKNEEEHLITLRKITATLKDGHIGIRGGKRDSHTPSIRWEWIEDKLVVTQIFDDNLNLKIGDIVTKVNNLPSKEFFEEVESRISAGTKGYLNHRAKSNSLFGEEDSEMVLEINDKSINLKRDKPFSYKATEIEIQENAYKELDQNIFYINLSKIKMDTISALMPKLEKAKGIVCDLRGYPKGNHGFISHLLTEKDTSLAWMKVPEIIYPDQDNIVGYENHGWEMEPGKPYLGDKKVVFIIDGRAISYAESYMGFIEGYDLATIVGQPTAGTNGNVNPFRIFGNYTISWTGMKVVKHDGSQHHGIGILPDIYVNKTIDGLKSGRDEFLEKAIEVINN